MSYENEVRKAWRQFGSLGEREACEIARNADRRIAELEAHLENINRELLKRTPGGSEFYNEPYTCLKHIDQLISEHRISLVAALKKRVAELERGL